MVIFGASCSVLGPIVFWRENRGRVAIGLVMYACIIVA